MNPLARVEVQWHGDTPVAAVDGEVDASNVSDVAAALRQLVTNRSNELVVDLSPTSYLDSAGINLLFSGWSFIYLALTGKRASDEGVAAAA